MTEQNKIDFCEHCQNEHTGNYCATCGRAQNLKRIDRNYVFSEIKSVLNLDKGILYTIKELLIRPGQNIRNFIRLS